MNENSILWQLFKTQRNFYTVVEHFNEFDPTPSSMFLEDNEDGTRLRLFFSEEDALVYRSVLIERDSQQPSSLSIKQIHIDEVYMLLPELETITEHILTMPLKVCITKMGEDDIMLEDEIFNTAALIN